MRYAILRLWFKSGGYIMYFAHKTDDNDFQTLKDHLEGTAILASEFSIKDLNEVVYNIGMLHDIGKYNADFQERLNGKNIKVEHSICGAIECDNIFSEYKLVVPMLQYIIAGHHSGIPDGGTKADATEKATLCARLKRETSDFSKYKDEIQLKNMDISWFTNLLVNEKTPADRIELYAFLTKYLFSCLTDADFIDTERFCSPDTERGIYGDFYEPLKRLDEYMENFEQTTTVQKARSALQKQAMNNSFSEADIDFMVMPTGSGKTLCSIKIALEKALRNNKKRIIYVIPYTSIIEQTADKLNEIFGDSIYVLQHHSNYSYDDDNSENSDNGLTAERLRHTCENWDAKIIVTTNVQFFQSLYHYKSSRLRKLHNLSDSIIVFDEIHLLPIEYLQPCLRAVGYITKYLSSEAIFLSATMPDFCNLLDRYIPDCNHSELIQDKSLFPVFENCDYTNLGKTTYEFIAEKAMEYSSSLIIVNSRKSARNVYDLVSGKKFHLSTYMTPVHRSEVIAKIRNCLKNNENITVVSTSLVEAGVDLDFESVFRELAGLDSILQSAGRCNREGLRENSTTYIFETEEKLHKDLGIRANITRSIINEYDNISSENCIHDYYNRLFAFSNEKIESNSISKFNGKQVSPLSIPFRSYAESFEYIKQETIGIVIDYNDEASELIKELKFGSASVRRKLQRYSVSVYFYELQELMKLGIINDFDTGVFILTNNHYYDKERGLNAELINDGKYILGGG